MPSEKTICEWLKTKPTFRQRYERVLATVSLKLMADILEMESELTPDASEAEKKFALLIQNAKADQLNELKPRGY